jgi:Type IV secretion system pilin
MLKRCLVLFSLLAFPLLAFPITASAVDLVPSEVCNRGSEARNSAVCRDNRSTQNNPGRNPVFGPNGALTAVINILSVIVGIAAVIMIILGGLKYVTSGSNPQDVASARERIIYALVALVIAALAQVIVRYVIGRF